MQVKERKICSFTQNNTRLQLVEIRILNEQQLSIGSLYYDKIIYQVRLNRRIIQKNTSEYAMRKVFASYCQNIVLQFKIY